MSGGVKVILFAGLLGVVFAAAVGVGAAFDPDPGNEGEAASGGGHGEDAGGGAHATGSDAAGGHGAGASDTELRLVPAQTRFAAGEGNDFDFEIVDADGRTVKDFDVEHERRMHLIVVRRDLTGFQHLHPRQDAHGGWSTPLRFATGGTHRVFADFASKGESQTVSADVEVAGDYEPRELPHPERTATTDSGYEVRLDETNGETRFTVFRNNRRIEDIDPYLGARGHLVALREGDLEFLHVHPVSKATEGSDIRFEVEYPSDGRYRLFLQFKVDGEVHTAAFTREVGDARHGH
jgi:hypothetical protein